MTTYYLWLFITVIIVYFIVTDASVAQFIIISTSWFRLQYEKAKWWVLYSPTNPIAKWMMWRRSMKLAKELMDEMRRD